MDVHATVNQGKIGAKRQTWQTTNPRSLLIKLIGENPHETRQDEQNILDLFWSRVKKNEDMLQAICEYWGTNNYRSIVYRTDPEKKMERQKEIDEAKRIIYGRIILLDWKMPNGKSLRECTKKDCLRAGGWLKKVASKLKPHQQVGQVFSEKQLHALIEQQ